MTRSLENYYCTTTASRNNGLRVYEGQSREQLLLQNLQPRFARFIEAFPIYLPRYAMSFEGSFMRASLDDQRIFTGAIFAGRIVEDMYDDTLAQRALKLDDPSMQIEDLWLSSTLTKTTKNILDAINVKTTYAKACMGSSMYDQGIAQRAFLTADNGRILIDPTLMLTEPCDISPAGLMRNMDGRTYMDTQPKAGAIYVGLNMRAKYYSKVKFYPESWYRL
ncbi:MAG: hypothetical protein H0W89_01195 [Candidatus Levybacteria bacterium]|nr:hypothetical protein [Candidatus Levybacteria bacterium]